MRKFSKRSRGPVRGPVDRSSTTDVVTQLEIAIRNPHAALIGALIGGLVPWFGRTLAHAEIPTAWATGNVGLAVAMLVVVVGCGVFSGLSVYKFGRAAFGDPRKALGFVLALEGVMLVSHGATSGVALAVLILINAVANGAVIALARDATRRRGEADARRAATRARGGRGTSVAQVASPGVHGGRGTSGVQAAPPQDSAQDTGRSARQMLVPPIWRRVPRADAIDAEIVSDVCLS